MANKYIVSVDEIESYIKFIKKYKLENEDNKRRMDNELKQIHSLWDDENYTKTLVAMDDVGKQLNKLYASLDETIKSLKKMNQAYRDYLNRR